MSSLGHLGVEGRGNRSDRRQRLLEYSRMLRHCVKIWVTHLVVSETYHRPLTDRSPCQRSPLYRVMNQPHYLSGERDTYTCFAAALR